MAFTKNKYNYPEYASVRLQDDEELILEAAKH